MAASYSEEYKEMRRVVESEIARQRAGQPCEAEADQESEGEEEEEEEDESESSSDETHPEMNNDSDDEDIQSEADDYRDVTEMSDIELDEDLSNCQHLELEKCQMALKSLFFTLIWSQGIWLAMALTTTLMAFSTSSLFISISSPLRRSCACNLSDRNNLPTVSDPGII